MEKYQDKSLSPAERAEDLLPRLSLREKVGQVNQHLYGFESYERTGDDFELSKSFNDENELWGGIGVLYGLYRADPWSGKDEKTGIPPKLSAKIYNKMQRAVLEKSRFGIPALLSTECPHGHQAVGGYLLPVLLAMGASFDPALVEESFGVVGKQIKQQGVDYALISMLDVLRDPRWGRSEECFSEDPLLAAEMAGAAVRGCKNEGLDVVAKHLCAQGQTTGGVNASAALIGERELREIHLPVVEAAAKNGAAGFMAAYNEIDGIPCHANPKLLIDYLRGELGFDGIVMADGTAIDRLTQLTGGSLAAAGALALESGVDVSLWDQAFKHLEEAVNQNFASTERLDEAVKKVLETKFARGLFENPFLDENLVTEFNIADFPQTLELARESAVLLKNEGVLPLKTCGKVAVIGPTANDIYHILGDYTPPMNSAEKVTLLDGIRESLGEENVSYSQGCTILSGDDKMLNDAVKLAKESDLVVLTLGGSSSRFSGAEFDINGAVLSESKVQMDCGEGVDAASLALPEVQLKLAEAIAETGKKVVVVVTAGRPYDITYLSETFPAVLYMFYPGPFGGRALSELLTGKTCPSGRLSASLPYGAEQLPCYYNPKSSYAPMSYYNSPHKPLFPFGYGLSYTEFAFTDFKLSQDGNSLKLSLTASNVGSFDGAAVPMVFISWLQGDTTSRVKELKAFERVKLKAGENKALTLTLDEKALSRYGADMKLRLGKGKLNVCLEEGGKAFFSEEITL